MSFLKKILTFGADETYNRAINFYNNCKYKDAIEEFDKIIQRDKGKSRLHRELAKFYKSQAYRNSGIIHMHEGRFDDALLDFKMALDILPESTILHTYLGICYNNVGRFNNAVLEFEKVILDREEDIQGHIRLALALRNQGLYNRAIEELRSTIKINPNHADLHYYLGLVLCNENVYQEAIGEFNKALEINPNYVDALSKAGFSYIMAGEPQMALEILNKVKKFTPHNELVLTALKMLEENREDRQSLIALAREELFKAITISLSLTPFVSPDISKEDKGLYNTLIYIYSQILQKHPNYADIHSKLAQIYENQIRYAEAEKEFKQALDINPDFIQARINLGFLYKEMSRFEDAALEFTHVVEKGFSYPTIAFNLGLIYKRLNKKEEAKKAFQMALEFDAGFKEAKSELETL